MKKFVLCAVLCVTSLNLQAIKVNLEVDSKISTSYPNCQAYVDGIIKLCVLAAQNANNSDVFTFLIEQVDFLKKNLKKCEKKKGSGYEWTIGVEDILNFDKKD